MINAHLESPRPRWDVIIFTIVLHMGALLALIPSTFSWEAIGVALFLYWLTIGVGVSLGFHRLATHRSFKVPKWLEYFFILCGALSAQGGVKGWVGYHRMHHLYTDRTGDPHDSTQGFWWSHISWLMHDIPGQSELHRFTKDIANDPFYTFCHQHYIALQIPLAGFLFILGGVPFVIWGVFVRLLISFHGTCLVNSACHTFGYRNYDVGDRSTNCWWVALLTFGEGWHNNHHADQSSAQFGCRWWEIDLVWLTIRFLEKLNLATNVKSARLLNLGE